MSDIRFVRDSPHLVILLCVALFVPVTIPLVAQEARDDGKPSEGKHSSAESLSDAQKKRVRTLISRLSAKSYSVRQKAMEKLLKVGHDAIPLFKEHLSTDNPEKHKQLLSILKQLGAWRAIPKLARERARKYLTLLKKERFFYEHDEKLRFNSWDYKEKAQEVFGRDAPDHPSDFLTSSMMNLIMQQADRSDDTLMKNIAYLFRFGPSRTAASLLSRLTRIDDPELQKIAFDSLSPVLSDISPPRHAKKSIRRGLRASTPSVRSEAIKLAGHLPAERTVPMLLDFLEHENADLRYQAYYTLRQVTDHNIYFNAWWKPERRKKAVEKWRSWWKNNKRTLINKEED